MLFHRLFTGLWIALSIGTLSACSSSLSQQSAPAVAAKLTSKQLEPIVNIPAPKTPGLQTAVFAGGCFWGVEGVFEHLKGVSKVVSGYAGGSKNTANYEAVSAGSTDHAESVQITYDPQKISYGQLLKVFFVIAHDPTELNRQGPDTGTQYRSAIFFTNNDQKKVAEAYIKQLNSAHVFPKPIVTQIAAFQQFYPAEEHHQDFIARNPKYPYVVVNDLPKLDRLRQEFPEMTKGF
jgi:peptide-methionine (S)-S-oxide reductase